MKPYLHPSLALLVLGLAAGGVPGLERGATSAQPLVGPKVTLPCLFDKNRNRNWKAWVDAMPGPGPRPALIVTGEVLAAAGMTGRLIKGATGGPKPPMQHFTVIGAALPNSPAGWRTVRAEVRPSLAAYSAVLIDCPGRGLARVTPVPVMH